MDPRQRLHMMEPAPARWPRPAGRSSSRRTSSRRSSGSPSRSSSSYAGRLAAAGDFRVDPAAHDRPAAHVPRPLVATTGAWLRRCSADPAVFGVELIGGRLVDPDVRLRGLHPGAARRSRGTAASPSSRSPRPTTRSRASSATWSADDAVRRPSSRSRCAALLGRRRLLLHARSSPRMPVLLGAVVQVRGGARTWNGCSTSSSSRPSCRSWPSSSGPRRSAPRSRTAPSSTS